MPDLKAFMALFFVIMLIISLAGTLFFRDNPYFVDIYEAFLLLTSEFKILIDFYLFPATLVGRYIGNIYFWLYLMINFFLVRNIIIAQLATTYNRVRKAGSTLYLLTALSVREVSEADDKYSAVISAPFPISILNLLFGSVVLAAKSPDFNLFVLHIYYFPIMCVLVVVFFVY